MVGEPTTTTYSDALLSTFIDRYPLMDELGTDPYTWTLESGVPTQTDNESWIATYDLAAAAADIWQEKAAGLAALYDFSADGGDYKRSQACQAAERMARFYRSKRSMKSIRLIKDPAEAESAFNNWQGNLPETL